MSKPALPTIDEFSGFKSYAPSGNYNISSIVLLLVTGIIAGALVGRIGYPITEKLVDLSFSILTQWFWSNLQVMSQSRQILFAIPTLIATIVIPATAIIATPFVLGFLNGYIMWLLAKKSKCGNPKIASWLTWLSAIVGYGVFTFMTFRYFGEKTWRFYILLGGFLVYIYGTIIFITKKVSERPFCEDCKQWHKDLHQGRYDPKIIEPLMQTLGSEAPPDVNNLAQISSNTYPNIGVVIYACPCCHNKHLRTTVAWEDNVEKDGKLSTQKNEEEWFNIMLPEEVDTNIKKLFLPT
jgi:hypothetical protein